MKAKHNKKRNTAFLFEALTRHIAKCILEKNESSRRQGLEILQEHFKNSAPLARELECYKALSGSTSGDKLLAEKMMVSVKKVHDQLDKEEIFLEQTKVIHKINKHLGASVFSAFVPNYRDYATIAQIFSEKTPVRNRVLLESTVVSKMCEEDTTPEKPLQPVDSLVLKTFIGNYNEKYEGLLPEQKSLLNKYILSFGPHKVDFQIALSEELNKIEKEVQSSLLLPEVVADDEMVNNTNQVLRQIRNYNVTNICEADLKNILKLQSLVREYQSDAD